MANVARKSYGASYVDAPSVNRKRWFFDKSHRVSTTMNMGALCPVEVMEVLPGDTWINRGHDYLCRLASPFFKPVMADIYLDSWYFFVPSRLCMENFQQVFSSSSPSAYEVDDLLTIPTIKAPSSTDYANEIGTVYDYMGACSLFRPTATPGFAAPDVSLLPFRAFALIWNEFFRNQNVTDETLVQTGDVPAGVESSTGFNTGAWSESNYLGKVPMAPRYKDYFSASLPGVQKGRAVRIPGIVGMPVSTPAVVDSTTGIYLKSGQTNVLTPMSFASLGPASGFPVNSQIDAPTGKDPYLTLHNNGGVSYFAKESQANESVQVSANFFAPMNLVVRDPADFDWGLAGQSTPPVSVPTIEALRTAMQLQRFLERDAVYGGRYREYLYAAYGVVSPDARMQVPELLSGSHERLNVTQVVNTSKDTTGTISAFSQTTGTTGRFSKSFTEHGYIIHVACIRYHHVYSQSVAPLWYRTTRNDFYDPLLANLGPSAVSYDEFLGGNPTIGQTTYSTLGYNPIYSGYRTIPSRVSGYMRPLEGEGQQFTTGQYYSLADFYDLSSAENAPTLLDLAYEDGHSFNRTLQAPNLNYFVLDFHYNIGNYSVVTPYGGM